MIDEVKKDEVKKVNGEESVKKTSAVEFDYAFERIAKSNSLIPSAALLSILGGIVKTSEKDSKEVIALAAAMKDLSLEEIISKTVLFTCNSVVMNIWSVFGKEIEVAYKKAMEKLDDKLDENKSNDA